MDIVLGEVSFSECVLNSMTGEDTKLLILVLYHAKDNGFKLFYCSDVKRGSTPNLVYDNLNMQSF